MNFCLIPTLDIIVCSAKSIGNNHLHALSRPSLSLFFLKLLLKVYCRLCRPRFSTLQVANSFTNHITCTTNHPTHVGRVHDKINSHHFGAPTICHKLSLNLCLCFSSWYIFCNNHITTTITVIVLNQTFSIQFASCNQKAF